MKAVIMAGGEGTRLRPLTCDLPKPMVPLMGRPTMEYIIDLLQGQGFGDIAVTLQYLPEKIRAYFGDGRAFGVNMSYFVEDTPLGTAGSVKNAAAFLDGDFIVISGDAVCDFDLAAAVDYHRRRDAAVTIVLSRVENPLEYGVVVTDSEGRIVRFLEKPGWAQAFADTVNTGIYIIKRGVLDLIPQGGRFDFSKDLFPLMMRRGMPLYGYCAQGYWCDIGDLAAYARCHEDILSGRVKISLPADHTAPGVYLDGPLPASGVGIIPPVFIGKNCIIEDGAVVGPHAVIGEGAAVKSGATVRHSVLHDFVSLGRGGEARGAIICRGASLLGGARMFEGSVLGAESTLGEHATLGPGIKIWPKKEVPDGASPAHNLIWGAMRRELFDDDGISGELGVDMTPELAARLGAAVAGVQKGMHIALGCDGYPGAQMIKAALAAGLVSAGALVWDIGAAFETQVGFAVTHFECVMGAHISLRGERCAISLYSGDGLSLPRAVERKIEAAFTKDDFLRGGSAAMGRHMIIAGADELYRRELMAQAGGDAACLLHLECEDAGMSYFLRETLQRAGCTLCEKGTPGAVRAAISRDGRELAMIDERGTVIDPERARALVSLALLMLGADELALPYGAPRGIDTLATRLGKRVHRVLNSPADQSDDDGRRIMRGELAARDACFALVKILAAMAESGLQLWQMVESLPPFSVISEQVGVPEERKGLIMRRILENAPEQGRELREGVRITDERGSILLTPKRRGGFDIRAEARDEETARELCDFYRGEILGAAQGEKN